jgi:Eco57I restriction-modification methylase
MSKIKIPSIHDLTENEIIQYFDNHLNIREEEKNMYGEVFTPSCLVNEILDHLPKQIWNQPHLKWLDPAVGIGQFPGLIYARLMKGLAKVISCPTKRKTHILKNMLYMVELNPQNVSSLRKLFGQRSNVSLANFLDQSDKWKRDLGVLDGFDIIVGNPPFQTAKEESYKGSVGNRTLWNKFVESILVEPILRQGGFLGLITPAGWRRPEHPLYDLMTRQNQLLYLHIYGKAQGIELLNAQTRFDLYIIQSGSGDKKTHIVDEKGEKMEINVRKYPFLPNFAYKTFRKWMVPKDRGIPILFSSSEYDARKLCKNKTRKYRFPVVHGITQKGLQLRYARNKTQKQFGISKVLLNFNEKQYPYNDYRGEYGMSQLTFAIPIQSRKDGERWVKKINDPEFQELLEATKWGAFQTDYRMFFYLDPKMRN